MTFPTDAITLIKPRLYARIPEARVLGRMLRPTDPDMSIGVFPVQWSPENDSMEMRGDGPGEPTLSTYMIGVQGLVRDGDEEVGLNRHSDLANRIRTVLYRDEPLRLSLRSLQLVDGTVTESPRKFGVRMQQFINNEVRGEFIYLSVLDFYLETECR